MKKLATLEVYEDNSFSFNSSSTQQVGPDEYRIVLRPYGGQVVRTFNADIGAPDMPSILAHELGHFAALIGGDQTHFDKVAISDSNSKERLNAEKRAWELAHLINPNLSVQQEKDSLGTYSRVQDDVA